MSTAVRSEYLSDWARGIDAKGREEGRAEGEGRAVLTVFDARGIPVPETIRERILACTDLDQLETWLRRAATASTAEEVIRP
jgi:hypothetical protein